MEWAESFMYPVFVNLLVSLTVASGLNCDLATPPSTSGETQAHGVIIYVYPRNPDIGENFSGCQTRWFRDGNRFRKLSVTRYVNGKAFAYDDINVDGKVSYHCQYSAGLQDKRNDARCPDFKNIMTKSYQPGCYSKTKLNTSNYYGSTLAGCELR